MAKKRATSAAKKKPTRKKQRVSKASRKRPIKKSSGGSPSCHLVFEHRLDAARENPNAHFHKGLAHNPATGEVDAAQFDYFIDQLKYLNAHPDSAAKGGFQLRLDTCDSLRKFVNPQAGWATNTEISDPCCYTIPDAPAFKSPFAAAEAIEVYWMALLRDVPFAQWDDNEEIAIAAKELSDQKLYINRTHPNKPPAEAGFEKASSPLTSKSVFRGGELKRFSSNSNGISEAIGPYISQFLFHEIPYGTLRIPQRFIHAAPGVDYMASWNEWLQVQDGKLRNDKQNLIGTQDASKRRYLTTMRDLATYVHFDALYEAYLNAALILLGGGYPTNEGNPYGPGCSVMGTGQDPSAQNYRHYIKSKGSKRKHVTYPDQDGFGTFGGPQVLSQVTEVATRALKAVWRQKWTLLRLRPEAYAGFVHRDLTGQPAPFDGFGPEVESTLRGSEAIRRILEGPKNRRGRRRYRTQDQSALLPMAFPEGSPTHPAYGAGHATVAGACVTVLKSFFDASVQFVGPVSASADGQHLVPYRGADVHGGEMTVELELNKLAANISIGRNMAGVHWRSDYTQSMLLGQRIAIDMLYRQSNNYTEDYSIEFNSFGGHKIEIRAGVIKYNGREIVSASLVDPGDSTGRNHCKLAKLLMEIV